MGKNDGLLIGGGLLAAFLFLRSGDGETPVISFGDMLSGGDTPFAIPDMNIFGDDGGGLFGGISGLFDNLGAGIGNLFTGLGAGLSGIQMPTITLPDMSGGTQFTPTPTVTPPSVWGGNDGGGFWNTPIINPSGSSIVDIGNTISQTAMSVAKAGLVGAGTYLGAKAAAPVVSGLGNTIAAGVKASTPTVRSVVTSGGRVVSSTAANLGRVLTSPVSKVLSSPLGKVGVAGAVITAGAAGYAAGSWFNTTSAGKALIEKSGQAGASFARNYGNTWAGRVLGMNYTTVNTSKTSVQLIQEAQSKGLTGQAAIQYARERLGK